MTDREGRRPSAVEQQEAAHSVLGQSEFHLTVMEAMQTLPNFSSFPVKFDEKGLSTVKGIKGKPNSAGLVILWGEERYPEINFDNELLGTTVAFRAAIVEAHADSSIVVKGRNASKRNDWTDENVRKGALQHALEIPGYFEYLEPVSDAEKVNLVPFSPAAGMNISDAADRMVRLANQTGKTVVASFNDIGITAKPGDNPGEISRGYTAAMRQSSDEYHKTPEASYRERERQAERRREVNKARKLLAKYPIEETETKPEIGEMPTPRYLVDAPSTVGDGITRWVGVETYGTDGEIKKMLWWRNLQAGDLNNDLARYHAAAFITRLKLETQADAAIGPAIDLSGSSLKTGYVQLVEEPGVYGVYIEAERRPMFNFFTMTQGIETEKILRMAKPDEFEAIFQKAKEVLPRPSSPMLPKIGLSE